MSEKHYESFIYTISGSCENVRVSTCNVGTRLIDPCDCGKYFQCNVGYAINNLTCPTGTLYDHTSQTVICNRAADIIHAGLCIVDLPWKRCNFTGSEAESNQKYAYLESRCNNGNFSFFVTAAPQTDGRTDTDDSTNAGAIVGAIMGVAILILLVVIVAILYRRKYFEKVEAHVRKSFKSRKSVQNPQYGFRDGSDGNIHGEETYSSINDAMDDPTYNPNPTTHRGRPLPDRPGELTDKDNFYVEPNAGGPTVGIGNPALQLDKEDDGSSSYTELTSSVRASAFASSGTATDDLNTTPYDNSWGGS
ncbi:hypothetical protein FSP39_011179 [Pinctada imbricata]|uniref:Chitin-binding type-2 domain-containing protein n=1 Tax=Pinctada imbricata TaxID=66713 RepID=A0AA89CAH4_PINIB|nr:hypothetical protein FSP39_011179 [Pinctada imbricata]